MLVKRFKNGNFNLKMEAADFDMLKHESSLVLTIWALQDYDCQLFGDEYCLGNAIGMAVDMYCYYTDMVVTIPYSLLDDLEAGKTIKLYAHKMDDWELEEYNRLVDIGEL